MIRFTTIIKKFEKQGEKTGWTYIEISSELAADLNPGVKTSFRVKGFLDALRVEKLALLPMGEGSFILPLKADLRKQLKKQKGAELAVKFEVDSEPLQLNADFLECLTDEPKALAHFESLAQGHRNYFSKWIDTAKTASTRAKRIGQAVNALAKGFGFPEMIRAQKAEKEKYGL